MTTTPHPDPLAAATEPTGTIMDVGHIVILMQENRSFDHYFGTMRGVRGFGDRFPIPVPAPAGQQRNVWLQRDDKPGAAPALVAPFHLDTRESIARMRVAGTPHTWPDAQLAWHLGRLDAWPTHKQNHAMGYFTEADLPFQFALADAFTVCDAYHCSVQAGTNPNRVYAWTGTIDPLQQGGGPVIGNSYDHLGYDPAGGYAWRTYAERLQQAGISWQVYQDMADNYTDNPLAGFRAFRRAFAGLPGSDPALRERGLSTHTLDQLRAFERLDIDRDRFVELAHQYVREWSADSAARRWLSPTDLDYIGRRLAPVRNPQQRLLVCRLAAAIITADGRVSDPERLVYRHALGRWNISHAMVTQAILADARSH